jgi:phage-related minor tail protein
MAWRRCAAHARAINSTATGGAVGLTTGQLEDSISNLDASNNGFGKNRESMLALIETGKFAGDALVSATRAAVGLSDLTGKSVEQTSALIARVAREPTAAIAELNSKYRLLSASVLAQISDLESQGRTLDATRLATDALGRVTEDRVAAANAGLNAMDGFLLRLKGGWAAMWAEAGRTESLDDEIAAIQVRINALRDRLVRPNRNDSRADIEARINALIADRTALIRANTAQIVAGNQASTDAAIQAAGDNALIALNAAFDASASKTEKLATALRKIQAQFEALKAAGVTSLRGLPLDEAQRRVEEAARKAAESKKQPVADPSVSIIAGLERQLALLGKNTEAERILEEIRSGGLKDASAATKQLAIDLAQLTDSERTRLATEQQIAALTPQLLRDVGREADAAALEIENSFGALRRNLTTIGDTSGLGLLDQALGIRAAKAELATLQQQLDTVMANAQQREQSIQTQLQARLITEAQGRKQISELQLKQADTVQALLPRMQALAQATGSPEALARVQQISAELDRMRLAADLLTQTLVTSFEDGLSGALVRLTESTTSLGEAAVGFVRSIAAALAQLAAQQVAQSATTGLLNLVRGAAPAASPEAAATTAATTAGAAAIGTSITTAGAAAATALGGALSAGGAIASTGITGSGSVAASSMGIAISSAGTVAAAAMGAAITAANIGSSLPGLSGGGYTGPGGKFQPAGIVHAGEFVARAAVVRQPGMLPLLHAINTEGMRAVHRLATGSPLRAAVPLPRHRSSIGYADGGLVGAGAVAPTVNNRFRFINMVDSADIGRRFAATPDFERSVLNVISSNPRAVRQEIS